MARPKSYDDFMKSLKNEAPPVHWQNTIKALWYDVKGDWNASHEIVQDIHSEIGNWLHAYLHRKEGDEFNARYWYRQANKPFPKVDLKEEQLAFIKFLV